MKTTLTIKGTHCNSCKMLIEDVVSEIPGITACTVNYETGETQLEHNETLDMEKLRQEIESLGEYKVIL